ncbi:hypothetical protein [Cupriavidus pampae]|uniref:Phage tail protein n=1 Tax=Cupriavidus pampae TaxID=659251 RepID=A0ABM8XD97_9BURK|nr:hypothetical protein [Cupriavidus pampae]CAG9177887.1 hypothetical protein LMG32289_03938 [Cupriavidus pampae]
MANDFLVFGGAGGANVINQATYAALGARIAGFASGVAQSSQLNKVWRQSSIMSAVLAQFISDRTGQDVLDDGTIATILGNLKLSAAAVNGDVTKAFSVAPATISTHALQLGQAIQLFGGSVTNVTSGTTTLTSQNAGLVLVNASGGNVTINLPPAFGQPGLPFIFIRIDNVPSISVTVNRTGTDTIDGVILTSFQLIGQYDRRHIKSSSTGAWYTVSASYASACSAYLSTAQTGIAGATFTKVSLQSKLADGGGEFDTSTFRFIAKQAGLYQINGGANINAPAVNNGYFCAIFRNGVMERRGTSVIGYAAVVQSCAAVSAMMTLSAGDIIELYVYGDAGFSLVNGPSATRLDITRVQ